MRAAHCILFSLLFASNSAFADLQLNLTPGVTPISHDIYGLHMTILWICIAIGILVFGVLFYSIIFHRKSAGYTAARFHEHLWVELTWTIIPLLILVVMAIPATRVLIHITDTTQPDITIKITGFQWKWKYEYLDHGVSFFSNLATPFAELQNKVPKTSSYLITVDKPLILPIHKKIRFLFTSNDVIHSWWVPAFGVKRDAVPGFINSSWTQINRAGTYHGQCAELCGINHAYMPIVVKALPEKDFDNWLAQQKGGVVTPVPPPVTTSVAPAAPTVQGTPQVTPAVTPVKTLPAVTPKKTLEELMQQGEKVYLGTCAVCHQPNGEGMPPTFPSLKGSPLTTGPLTGHIDIVLHGKPGTAMQAFQDQLNDDDLAAVITYERNSWGNKTGIVQPEDVKAMRK